MSTLILLTLAGAVLGSRFKVLMAIPLIAVAVMFAAVVAVIKDESFGLAIFTMALVAAALQFGYLFGAVVRFGLAAARAPRERPEHARGIPHPAP